MKIHSLQFTSIVAGLRERFQQMKWPAINRQRLELLVILVVIFSIATLTIEMELEGMGQWSDFFYRAECFVVIFFTLEYIVRWIASRRLAYPLQPMAIVDLLAVLPFYLGFLIDLRTLRLLRVMRVMRLFKLYRYTTALQSIINACYRIRYEFGVIGFAVFTLAWIGAVALYELERDAQPAVFSRLSDGLWCVLVTLTTVGYGDKVPMTSGGKFVALCIMLGGLGLFGTFVSLIGSAFLEELRRNPRPQEASWFSPHPDAQNPEEPPREFEPTEVLQQIQSGHFNGGGRHTNRDLRRLLAIACQRLETAGELKQDQQREKSNE